LKHQCESAAIVSETQDLEGMVSEKRNVEMSLRQAKSRLQDIKDNLDVKDQIFKQAESY
jgi:hypothetical protein